MEATELMHFQQDKAVQLCQIVSNLCSYMLSYVRSCVRSCATWTALQHGMQAVLVTIHNSQNAVLNLHIMC